MNDDNVVVVEVLGNRYRVPHWLKMQYDAVNMVNVITIMQIITFPLAEEES